MNDTGTREARQAAMTGQAPILPGDGEVRRGLPKRDRSPFVEKKSLVEEKSIFTILNVYETNAGDYPNHVYELTFDADAEVFILVNGEREETVMHKGQTVRLQLPVPKSSNDPRWDIVNAFESDKTPMGPLQLVEVKTKQPKPSYQFKEVVPF